MIETASIRGECSLDAAAFLHIYNLYLIDTVTLTYYIPDCAHHGLRVAREITGLFRSAIPLPKERGLFDHRPWNVRRGMIPDGSVATGHGPDRLLECKFLHWGVSTYTDADLNHEDRCRSVERRAGKVHDDYVKAAAKLDAAHCGTLPDERPGPVERKLASLGPVQPLVVGHYGEMGRFVDELLELAAVAGLIYILVLPCIVLHN